MSRISTFAVERHPDLDGIWLCLDDGKGVTPIAIFTSDDAAKRFNEALTHAKAAARAAGASGI